MLLSPIKRSVWRNRGEHVRIRKSLIVSLHLLSSGDLQVLGDKTRCIREVKCIHEVISVRDDKERRGDKVCRSTQLTIAALVPMVRGLVPGTHHVQARLWLNHGQDRVSRRDLSIAVNER